MTIGLPDLTNYTNLKLIVALAAPYDPSGTIVWEISHRDMFQISSDLGTIDLFRPISNFSPLRSQTYLTDLGFTFQNFEYSIDSSMHSVTFTFASTDYPETIGIDSVSITGSPVPQPQPPVALCQDVTVAAGSTCDSPASIDNGSYDPDGDAITLSQSPPGPYPLGSTLVTLTVTDSTGASS